MLQLPIKQLRIFIYHYKYYSPSRSDLFFLVVWLSLLEWKKLQHFRIQNKAASEQQDAFKYSLLADTVLLSDCGG